MEKELERIAVQHGDRLKVIPIEHLSELRGIIDEFKEQEELNHFQNWIVNDLYQFEVPEANFKIHSIILVAVHHPFCAKVEFNYGGEKKTFNSLVRADKNETKNYINEVVKEQGYSLKEVDNLPMKRLGVHSGLAKYGRNNITYIDGLGSNFSYVAYFSDITCEKDTWGESKNAEACSICNLCIKSCPTKAIRKDRFLIDNQKCLSCINEGPGEFPDWVPVTAHHALYDCLICQRVCPMNSKQLSKVLEGISFTEEETAMLLEGKPVDSFSEEMKEKVDLLGINDWYDAIPRNLKILLDNSK